MIQQTHKVSASHAVSIEATTSFDVLWGKPLFRAPNLPAKVNAPALAPFTTHPNPVTRARPSK